MVFARPMRSSVLLVLLPSVAIAGPHAGGKAPLQASTPHCRTVEIESESGRTYVAPRFHEAVKAPPLQVRWRAEVGRTTFRTTLALLDGEGWIGTHGATLGGKNERSDGVYVLNARTGAQKRFIPTPGSG